MIFSRSIPQARSAEAGRALSPGAGRAGRVRRAQSADGEGVESASKLQEANGHRGDLGGDDRFRSSILGQNVLRKNSLASAS